MSLICIATDAKDSARKITLSVVNHISSTSSDAERAAHAKAISDREEAIVALNGHLKQITNLNADAHVAVLRDEIGRMQPTGEVRIANALNTEPFILPATEVHGAEQYLLPPADSEIGELMRTLLVDMRIRRDPQNKITLKEMQNAEYDGNVRDGSVVEVTQTKGGAEYLHELVSRLVN